MYVSNTLQLFRGSFYYCDGPFVTDVVTIDDCLKKVPRELYKWKNREYNFDDLGQVINFDRAIGQVCEFDDDDLGHVSDFDTD